MQCTLYLVRHGIAGPVTAGMSDRERALTSEGERKMRRVALGLKRLGVAPEVILSSPLRRAEETATILAAALAPARGVVRYPSLAPGQGTADVLAALHPYRAARSLMLVGHQPDLGELASHLLTGSSTLVPLVFKKGGAAAIAVGTLPPRTDGVLLWFLTPGQLRAIGRGR
jgi:phosphohistidine phosphatase